MIKVVSDSTCDLTPELLERFDIKVLPLHVLLGEADYLDGVNITPDEIYRWSDENKTTPKTAAPSLGETIDVFKPILDAGDEIISFSISAPMSASNSNMHLAAEALRAEDRVSVVDSMHLTVGVAILAIRASVLAKEGMAREDIVKEVEAMRPYVQTSFVVDTLTYLHRGGRCSAVAALAGSMLKLHPKIELSGGAMYPRKKYRGAYDKVVLNYAKDMEEGLKRADPERVFIVHSGIDPAIWQSVNDYVTSLNRFKEIIILRVGSVISSHCGYGTLGVIFTLEKDS